MAWYIYIGIGDSSIPSSCIKSTLNPTCINDCIIYAIDLVDNTIVPITPSNQNGVERISNAYTSSQVQPFDFQIYVRLKSKC
ncbi:hypothetical protein SAMN04488522_104490 [Pedobacter caeni]|uniref:Uncharacterized protein n=1 Tax=Pedobacter caeni TaxID=288992 RepID=A0A1M5H3D2_9SPHI|nr:hypothetical protein SAMN04488522_104490 [Pedobacter caeni]